MWFHWFETTQQTQQTGQTIPFSRIRGADWFLEDNMSYEILSQQCVPGTQIICIQTKLRPRDWTGPFYLETTAGTQQILKKDEKGVWFWRQGWMGVHWFGSGPGAWSDVERWLKSGISV
jgi:hypothetical protein